VTAREVLDGIKAQLEAATPGPWEEYWQGHIHAPANYPQAAAESVCQTFGREDRRHPNAAFIASAPSTVARLTAAVEAVLALHAPDTYGECRRCHGGNGFYHAYPCPTVAAIENALEGE